MLAALFVLVPFCYLSGSFTINPVTEATSQARHLQLLSGCPPLIYWAGFYVSALLCSTACLAKNASSPARRGVRWKAFASCCRKKGLFKLEMSGRR